MMEYETLCVVPPEWTVEQVRRLFDRLKPIVERHHGTVLLMKEVGRRPLGYRVQKHTKGTYLYCNYTGGGALVPEIERILRLEEEVLKYTTVNVGLVESIDARRGRLLEDEARLAQLFGSGSEAAGPPAEGAGAPAMEFNDTVKAI